MNFSTVILLTMALTLLTCKKGFVWATEAEDFVCGDTPRTKVAVEAGEIIRITPAISPSDCAGVPGIDGLRVRMRDGFDLYLWRNTSGLPLDAALVDLYEQIKKAQPVVKADDDTVCGGAGNSAE